MFSRRDGQGELRIIDFICTHSPAQCDDFAHLLLNDMGKVRKLHIENKDPDEFVRAVLRTWINTDGGPAVPRTWSSLVDVMRNAALYGITVQAIRKNVC